MFKFKLLFFSIAIILISNIKLSAQNELRSGPMLGYCEMREVLIWLQTKQEADVYLSYYDKEIPKVEYRTDPITTTKDNWHIAKIICDKVLPNRTYVYRVFVNGKEQKFSYPLEFSTLVDWQYKEPKVPDMRIVFGSGSYINDEPYDRAGQKYGGNYEIYEAVADKDPDIMLWLGDNVYYRDADWNTKTGMYYRNTQVRELPEMQRLLATAHHYAIYDDHDFGPNDSDGSFIHKPMALDVFKDFWGNPTYGFDDLKGCMTSFSWGDADFFLLDNRYHRTPNYRKTGKRSILGDEQIEWLINSLAFSKAKFKIIAVGGQFLNPLPVYENHATFAEERQKLIDLITIEDIKGVIFVTGDRHFSEMTKYPRKGKYDLYDLTASPFNSGPFTGACEKEQNFMRVDGSCVAERNFGMIEITGERTDRKIKFSLCGVDGTELWQLTLSEKDLR